jgi:hypothetical protein
MSFDKERRAVVQSSTKAEIMSGAGVEVLRDRVQRPSSRMRLHGWGKDGLHDRRACSRKLPFVLQGYGELFNADRSNLAEGFSHGACTSGVLDRTWRPRLGSVRLDI